MCIQYHRTVNTVHSVHRARRLQYSSTSRPVLSRVRNSCTRIQKLDRTLTFQNEKVQYEKVTNSCSTKRSRTRTVRKGHEKVQYEKVTNSYSTKRSRKGTDGRQRWQPGRWQPERRVRCCGRARAAAVEHGLPIWARLAAGGSETVCGIPPRIPDSQHADAPAFLASLGPAGSLWCEHAGGLVQPLAPGSGDRECAVPMAES